MKPPSQTDRILKWLQSGKKINPIQALNKFGCMRLARVIHELKQGGVDITSEMVRTKDGKKYARYELIQ